MKIAEVFLRPIERELEQVIQVEAGDERRVADELIEYVATERLEFALGQVIDAYNAKIQGSTGSTTIQIAGPFGSGRSSLANVIAYLIANPSLEGRPACEWFFRESMIPSLRSGLARIHAVAPTTVVPIQLSSSRYMLSEGEGLAQVMYRALLDRLGYSQVLQVAEQEIRLEQRGGYDEFTAHYVKVYGHSWFRDHDSPLAKMQMSRVLHDVEPDMFQEPDTFARASFDFQIGHRWLAERTVDLLDRRELRTTRVIFIVDEIGPTSDETNRALELNGVGEAFASTGLRLWLLYTSLEPPASSSLAQVAAHSLVRVHLDASDAEQIVVHRLLDKSLAGANAIHMVQAAQFDRREHLESGYPLSERQADDEAIAAYPFTAQQLRMMRDMLTQCTPRQRPAGVIGSLFQTTRQVITDPNRGIGSKAVGHVVATDQLYDVMAANVPNLHRTQVDVVVRRHGGGGLISRVMKLISWCAALPACRLDERSMAGLLREHLSHVTPKPSDIGECIRALLEENAIVRSQDGYLPRGDEE